jgi:feruloyl esterase
VLLAALLVVTCQQGADAAQGAPARAASDREGCEALFHLRNLTITHAGLSETGDGVAYCYVRGILPPAIHFHVQLPLPGNWNGRFLKWGDGGKDGDLDFADHRVVEGYAVANSNTGHDNGAEPGSSFAYDNRQAEIDFGYRAVHLTVAAAKTLVRSYYGDDPAYSYFEGCSTGGRQGLMEAQRYPTDFDGIVAGAPGNDWTGRAGGSLRVAKPLEANEAARLTADLRELVHGAVLDACDAGDGVTDGVVGDPEGCGFDPAALQCADGQGEGCLSSAQVNTARMLYSSPENPRSGRPITGLFPGSELGWTDLGWTRSARSTGLEQFRYLTFADPEWTVDQFNFETDIVLAEDRDNDTLNALDPNLKPFFESGGKLLSYHGWSDPQISPANVTQYYSRVVDLVGTREEVHDSFRLFMAPGMGHCGGGAGPSRFDMLTALERWVEEGDAPDHIMATRVRDGEVDRTRPLCPYPAQAVYTGAGSTDEAENFACRMPSGE